jgi:Ran GTPase-activating protein (RanGAP) involved in mRNA processing and transport
MIRNYSLGQRCTVYLLLVSLFLQSCNHPSDPPMPPKEVQGQPDQQADREELARQVSIKEEEGNSIVPRDHLENALIIAANSPIQETIPPSYYQSPSLPATTTLGDLDKLPRDVLNVILAYTGSKMSKIRALNRAFYKLTTGHDFTSDVGVKNKPQFDLSTNSRAIGKEVVDFEKMKGVTPESIPSLFFYRLIGESKNLPQSFWPYLAGTKVHTISLVHNGIGDAGAIELAKVLPSTQVHTLDLYNNRIGAAGAIELAKHLPGTHVHTLYLSNNQIGDLGVKELAKVLANTQLRTLNLGYNQIGDLGVKELAKVLANTQVHVISLYDNKIGAAGAIELAKALPNTQVYTLHLVNNQIGAEGAVELAKRLKGTQIQTLDLGFNQIGAKGAIKLAKHLPGSQVRTLDLHGNEIGDAGAIELAKHLPGTQIQTLDLRNNQIDNKTQQTLREQYPTITWTF